MRAIFVRWSPLLLLLLIGSIYTGFRIKVHSWESYAYAASAEGFYSLPYEHSTHNSAIAEMPDFNHYHPNHPLLYLMVYLIYNLLSPHFSGISALAIVQALNIIMSLAALALSYWIALKLSGSTPFSLLTTAILAFTNVYWYQSLSGEVYIGAFLFMALSFALLLGKWGYPGATLGALSYGLAAGFHILAVPFYLVALFLICSDKLCSPRRRLSRAGLFTGVSLLMGFLLYILPFITLMPVGSVKNYFQTMTLYSSVLGSYRTLLYRQGWATVMEVLKLFREGAEYAMNALLSLPHPAWAYLMLLAILLLIALYLLGREKRPLQSALLLWAGLYFAVIIMIVPDVNDYWCLMVFPLTLFSALSLKGLLKRRYLLPLLGAVAATLFTRHFVTDIYPKATLREERFYAIDRFKEELKGYDELFFIIDAGDLVIPEFWRLIHERGEGGLEYIYNRGSYFYYVVGDRYERDLEAAARRLESRAGRFLLICEKSQVDLEGVNSIFTAKGYRSTLLHSRSAEVAAKYYKRSCNHYKGEYIQKNLVVYLYERN